MGLGSSGEATTISPALAQIAAADSVSARFAVNVSMRSRSSARGKDQPTLVGTRRRLTPRITIQQIRSPMRHIEIPMMVEFY
jgi:hypothetical protein